MTPTPLPGLRLKVRESDGRITGPHTLYYLRRELDSGNLTLDHMGKEEGGREWLPLLSWGSQLYPQEVPRAGSPTVQNPLLKQCPACSGRVSVTLKTCLHCGHRFPDEPLEVIHVLFAIIIIILAIILGLNGIYLGRRPYYH